MTTESPNNLKQPTLSELGGRIRSERHKRRLTLEALSERTGLSKSLISQVERGHTEPSITTLKKISAAFGFSVVKLFANSDNGIKAGNWEYHEAPAAQNPAPAQYIQEVEVVRADRRKRFALPGSNVIYDLLTPDMNRQIEVMYMKVKAGETSGDEPMMDPEGEKVGLVLEGSLEVTVDNHVYSLDKGDCIYYPANAPHSWRATGGESVDVIWILTPPSF